MEEITAAYVRRLLPRRDPMGHKGTFGKVLCVCGSVGFSGAAGFAASAAFRSTTARRASAATPSRAAVWKCQKSTCHTSRPARSCASAWTRR